MSPAIAMSVLVASVAFVGGMQFAEGRAAKRELAARVEHERAYHAKEIEYSELATRLEESLAANHRISDKAKVAVAAIGNRPLYLRDCFDTDGLRVVNDALRGPNPPSKHDTKMPAADPP